MGEHHHLEAIQLSNKRTRAEKEQQVNIAYPERSFGNRKVSVDLDGRSSWDFDWLSRYMLNCVNANHFGIHSNIVRYLRIPENYIICGYLQYGDNMLPVWVEGCTPRSFDSLANDM